MALESTQASSFNVKGLDKTLPSPVNLEVSAASELSVESSLSEESLKTTIGGINSEIIKEVEVIKVGEELNETLKREKTQVEGQEGTLKNAKENVSGYRSFKTSARRSRRSTDGTERSLDNTTLPSSLSKQQREVLESFFKAWSNLSEEQQKLFSKLKEASKSDIGLEGSSYDANEAKKVLRSLKRIDWKKDKLQLTPIRGGQPEKKENITKEKAYGWKFDKYKWEESPWDVFFEEEKDWVEIMDSLQASKDALNKYLKGQMACGILLFIFRQDKWCTKDKEKFNKLVSFNEGAVGLHIADWMLKKMESQGQI